MKNPFSSLAVALIAVYQYGISPVLPASCRFHPSCSAYAIEAIRRFGLAGGGWLAAKRVARCHPWGACGEDPVPHTLDTTPVGQRAAR